VSLNQPTGEVFVIRSSRIWALLTFKLTQFIFPIRMTADTHGISLHQVSFWLTPWSRKDEHLPMTHVAEIELDRGLIWDAMRIESSGGIDPLLMPGLSKFHSGRFVAVLRGMIGKST
jgi:hypothetical protein